MFFVRTRTYVCMPGDCAYGSVSKNTKCVYNFKHALGDCVWVDVFWTINDARRVFTYVFMRLVCVK